MDDPKERGKMGGRGNKANSETISFSQKRDKSYWTRRLARDRPDLLAAWEAGEIKSVRQAAILAGFVREKSAFERAVSLLEGLKGKLTPEQSKTLRELI